MPLTNDHGFNNLQYLTADNIHSPKVAAIFSTRNGGVSGTTPETEYLHSMNLQLNPQVDSPANTEENHRIIAASQGFNENDIMNLWQRHTDKVIAIDKTQAESRPHTNLGEADAVITNIEGILLAIRVADCVPILLYDSANNAIGAVHAGWRGTFTQIGAKTVKEMCTQYGTNPANIKAAIGPAIGVCCFEVGADFYEQFHNEYGDAINEFFKLEHGRKPHCNLALMNMSFLINAGVCSQNIDISALCTMCNPKLFYSHRRSGEKRGTMAAFIGMKS